MKKIVSAILCMALLMLLSVQALAAEGDLIIARTADGSPLSSGLESFCGMGDALYFMLYGDRNDDARVLGVHRVGETQMKQYSLQIGEPLNSNSYEEVRLLASEEKLYALRLVSVYIDDEQNVSAALYEITIDGEKAQASLVCEPDWSFFQSEYGYFYLRSIVCAENYAVLSYYDDTGTSKIAQMRLSDGSIEECDIDGEIINATIYVDGKILLQQYANDMSQGIRLVSFDPETGSSEVFCEIDAPQYEYYYGLACDFETGALYYSKDGEIFELDPQTGESSEAITDTPDSPYSDTVAVVLSGGYYATASYDCYLMRNLHPSQKASARLKICDTSYEDCVQQAYYAFSNEHSDVSTVLSRNYSSQNSLVEEMMNRSSDVDVYVMDASSSSYEAVFDRGYVAELTDSEKLRSEAERIYPALREELSINGELCAIPVSCYFFMPFVRENALEKLNMTIEDVPTNWSDFLDFLLELPEKLPADGSVSLMDSWMGDTSAKRSLFDALLINYQQLLAKDPDAFSTDQMVELLEKLEKVDFQALGQPTEEETQSDEFYTNGDQLYLLETNMGTSIGGIRSMYPLVMSLTPDTPKMLAVYATVAIVNPYSENRELALEFMEKLVENLSDEVGYTMFSDLTEPVENKYYQENVESMQASIDALRKEYENAPEADRQAIQESLQEAEANLKDYEQYRYSLSEADIAWIHQNADALTIQHSNWLYNGDSGDAAQLVSQYIEGQLSAKELMDEIGRKIRMMMMEGY